ncbi:MAG: DUF1810 domain-containing protein [Ferruginibacter sp.]
MYNLKRFLDAQSTTYAQALQEIQQGRKQSHWMWYIFPQIAGLGRSETAKHYAIKDLQEAHAYISHHVLGARIIEIAEAFLIINNKTANQVFGSPDDLKLRSCMSLFASLENPNVVFQKVLDKYYDGEKDNDTVALLSL